ncbi:MAG: hypothetical protein DMG92_15355 [Acidobacteria bacterium]|nr:MAG: hypothetical protein DMG92_15355 [Acidobacteriota bacterium]
MSLLAKVFYSKYLLQACLPVTLVVQLSCHFRVSAFGTVAIHQPEQGTNHQSFYCLKQRHDVNSFLVRRTLQGEVLNIEDREVPRIAFAGESRQHARKERSSADVIV